MIQLPERGVDVGRDAKALKFLVHDWHGEDVMFVEQILGNGVRGCPFDVDVGDGARLIRIERSWIGKSGLVLFLFPGLRMSCARTRS